LLAITELSAEPVHAQPCHTPALSPKCSHARANELATSYVNSVIWTAGTLSGARLTNTELRAIKAG
jgi:hypothetical protein